MVPATKIRKVMRKKVMRDLGWPLVKRERWKYWAKQKM